MPQSFKIILEELVKKHTSLIAEKERLVHTEHVKGL